MSTLRLRLDGRKILSRVLLLLASALLTLVLLEIGLRFLRPIHYMQPMAGPPPNQPPIHQRSSIPGLKYELAPNREIVHDGVLIKTNRYGMRDDTPVSIGTDSLRRIVVLGDSNTFGWKVPAEAAYPQVLEKLLNESARRAGDQDQYDVLNLGVIGYSTAEETAVLRYKALAWDPDLVVLGYVMNDPDTDPPTPESLQAYFDRPRWWQHSHLLRLLARLKSNWEIDRLGGGDYLRYLHAEQGDKWKNVVKAFSEIRALTSERAIPVLVVIFPEIWRIPPGKSWEAYPYKGIHKQVSALAIQNGFRVIDLYDVYSRAQQDPSKVILSRQDNHPNSLGHEIAARAIARELLAGHDFFFHKHRKNASQ